MDYKGYSYVVKIDGYELGGFFVEPNKEIRNYVKAGAKEIKVLIRQDKWKRIFPASSIAIRDSDDHGMRMVKVFIYGLPVDYSYGSNGWDHGCEVGVAQRGVWCLKGHEREAAVIAYSELYAEYADFNNDYENGWESMYGLPRPGSWILDVPHFEGTTGMGTCGSPEQWTDLP